MTYASYIWIWAPGVDGFALPPLTGFPFNGAGGGGKFRSIHVQIHYDNPYAVEGRVDTSGLRIFRTEALRPHDAGVLQLADPNVYLAYGSDLSSTNPLYPHGSGSLPLGASRWRFECSSSSTAAMLAENVTAFGRQLHMHAHGIKMEARQYRGANGGHVSLDSSGSAPASGIFGVLRRQYETLVRLLRRAGWYDKKEVRRSTIDYYDYYHQGDFIPDSFGALWDIQPGDSFLTDCYYRANTPSGVPGISDVKFGFASQEEMCIDFIYYYPRQTQTDGVCTGIWSGLGIEHAVASPWQSDDEFLDRQFGASPSRGASDYDVADDLGSFAAWAVEEGEEWLAYILQRLEFYVSYIAEIAVEALQLVHALIEGLVSPPPPGPLHYVLVT